MAKNRHFTLKGGVIASPRIGSDTSARIPERSRIRTILKPPILSFFSGGAILERTEDFRLNIGLSATFKADRKSLSPIYRYISILCNFAVTYPLKFLAMYPEELVKPMRAELSDAGFEELYTADAVQQALEQPGTTFVVVNSVCGCAARNARPGAKLGLANAKRPDRLVTVFAGVDKEAVDAAREKMFPFPPSSPSMALFKDGELVHVLERHHIEGRPAELIAENLKDAFNEFC